MWSMSLVFIPCLGTPWVGQSPADKESAGLGVPAEPAPSAAFSGSALVMLTGSRDLLQGTQMGKKYENTNYSRLWQKAREL